MEGKGAKRTLRTRRTAAKQVQRSSARVRSRNRTATKNPARSAGSAAVDLDAPLYGIGAANPALFGILFINN